MGVPIIVYRADSISEEMLPPIVQGDVWEEDLARVVIRAADIVTGLRYAGTEPREPMSTASLADITVEQLKTVVTEAVLLASKNDGLHTPDVDEKPAAQTRDDPTPSVCDETSGISSGDWRRRILWVDDRPDNNLEERSMLESLGLLVAIATSTNKGLDLLKRQKFAAIVSDMGRPEGPREGYKLLDAVRYRDPDTPFFFYVGSRSLDHRREAEQRGAQGVTNVPRELIEMIVNVLPARG